MQPKILKPSKYGVFVEGGLVKLQVGNSVLPMTWDVARRISTRLRIHLRDAQEFIGQARTLGTPNLDGGKLRTPVRESDLLLEDGYAVYSEGPDVILKIGSNAVLTMPPDVAHNISVWLNNFGVELQPKDVAFNFALGRLTDANAVEAGKQARRDSTAQFGR